MPSIDLVGVTHAFADSVPLFTDLDLRLIPGWMAVVGANGAGKTTLLRLAAGELAPDRGAVRYLPARLEVHLCAQRVEDLEPAIVGFAARSDRSAHRLRGQLELHPLALDHWRRLSPGERKRWQVGAALAAEPGALLLDEPTNHLDLAARKLLAQALARYEGIGLLVSHDRGLMNQLAQKTLRLKAGVGSLYEGGYDQARACWEAEAASERRAYQKVRSEKKKLERKIDDRRRKWQKAANRATTSKRMKNPRDSAARGTFKLTRRRSAENALGREIQKLHGSLGRVEREASTFELTKEVGRSLFVDYAAAPVPLLAAFEGDLHAGEGGDGPRLQCDLRVPVRRDTRLHLRGPNGAGKTTLLKGLVECSRIPAERLLYLPQELGAQASRQLLRDARELSPELRGKLLGIVAALGIEPALLLESSEPSPGEARKLALAAGVARRVGWGGLDEPTNHLYRPSIARLDAALCGYPGAIVLATHDDRFAERVTTTRIELSARGEPRPAD